MAENMSFLSPTELPADCLLEIFSYLSLDDMMQIKNVCRNWYQVSQYWFNRVQTLVFSPNYTREGYWELWENHFQRKTCTGISYKKLTSILQLYGHHIKYFKMDHCTATNKRNCERHNLMFQLIPELCQNIVNFKMLEYESFPPSTYKSMATHWKKLEKLHIEYLTRTVGNDVCKLLRNNEQLKTVTFVFDDNPQCPVNDKFFTYLPTTIQEIKIVFNSNQDKKLKHFISARKNFTSLRSLKFFNLYYLSDAVVEAIGEIESLTHLTLHNVKQYQYCDTICLIACLDGLKSLDLSRNFELEEDSLIYIVDNCTQLEELDLHDCGMLTDEGMAAIAELEELKILNIYAVNVSSESIINLSSSLEVFQCLFSSINNRDAIMFLEKAKNLRLVDFGACFNLTRDLTKEARKIANQREKNILYMSGLFDFPESNIKYTSPYFEYIDDFFLAPRESLPNYIGKYLKALSFTRFSLPE